MNIIIYFIATSQLLQNIWRQAQCSLLHDSFHYNVVIACLINPTHVS